MGKLLVEIDPDALRGLDADLDMAISKADSDKAESSGPYEPVVAMTDKERLLALFAEFGLEPSIDKDCMVDLGALQPKVEGYIGFVCRFDFMLDGSFSEVQIYED